MTTSRQNDPIVGIDLGTTNSLVAYCDEKGPRILPSPEGQHLLPSVVRFDEQGNPAAIGTEARRHAVEHPTRTVFSVKRLMGRSRDDVAGELAYLPYEVVAGDQNTARVKVGDRVLSPQEISAMILRELRRWAESALGTTVRRAVITVPAYFDDAQRQATRDAGRIAGLEVLRIVNEPTAAALAYNIGLQPAKPSTVSLSTKFNAAACATPASCRDNSGDVADASPDTAPSQIVAVFDLGGGTFDVSILRLAHTQQGIVDQVLATAGDTHLGGDDVDRLIVESLQRDIQSQFGQHIAFPPATRQAFRNLAEAAKIRLSDEKEAKIEIDLGNGRSFQRTITRDELEQMVQPWVQRAIDCCRLALKAAKLTHENIDRVILVGGSTRMPVVRRAVAEAFVTDPYTALNPDEVVALGAAVQASVLAGTNRQVLLLDVIPLSLGIETLGGAVAKLIMANSTIPARATEMFTTHVEGQTNVSIHVLQGERELVKDCRSLGRFDLRGIPPMPAGLPKINVTFLIDANGILNVMAEEQRSGKAARIQIIPNHGLTREEVARMENESFAHAQEDMSAHRLIDLKNQAKLDLRAIDRQLQRVADELDADYRREIGDKVAAVQTFLDTDTPDLDAFHHALDAMDKATVRLAEVAIRRTLSE
ncbi:MAG: Hsp70 family protein [Phycisphaeraceae bacterium]|nr:Hsp70 family protein [Phycisphaeraceae bacterium]